MGQYQNVIYQILDYLIITFIFFVIWYILKHKAVIVLKRFDREFDYYEIELIAAFNRAKFNNDNRILLQNVDIKEAFNLVKNEYMSYLQTSIIKKGFIGFLDASPTNKDLYKKNKRLVNEKSAIKKLKLINREILNQSEEIRSSIDKSKNKELILGITFIKEYSQNLNKSFYN